MSKKETEFEVIDQYGERHRFKRADGYSWAWRPKPGTIDTEGTDFLDVFKHFEEGEDDDGEGDELVVTFPKPAAVGNVRPDTGLCMPMRELQMEQCPRCGFITRPNARGNAPDTARTNGPEA